MKTRTGFVSNSSSSSFIVSLDDITAKQVKLIECHAIKGKKLGMSNSMRDAWNIEQTETELKGNTYMDNFDMREFMEKIGVDLSKVEFEDIP